MRLIFTPHRYGGEILGYRVIRGNRQIGYIRRCRATRLWLTTQGVQELAHANTLEDAKRQAPDAFAGTNI